jgi:hypothetical protein
MLNRVNMTALGSLQFSYELCDPSSKHLARAILPVSYHQAQSYPRTPGSSESGGRHKVALDHLSLLVLLIH